MAENKVIKLQKQILELTKEINKNGEATKKQAKELEKLEKQYNKLSSKQMPQYRKRHEEVNKALGSANKLTAEATKKTQSFSSRIGSAIKTLGAYGVAYKLINAATQAFTELTVGSAKQAIEFEKSVANLGAVAGVSGEELNKLAENALDVAGSTKFTANEIVTLQTELSKLGFTAEDVIKSTQGIANVAQALGSPLGSTAEQVGKIINQFDLLIEQAGFVGDVLVTAINESALSFDSFGTAIQYVGPIAKNLGLTFEQTAGAMAVLADNGFTASRIGTGLRGIFTELGKTSADVEKSLKKLADQNISLSEAVDLVGKRNAAQLITLLKNIDAIDESTGKYYQQGRALAASAEQINTFSGQMAILNSAFRETQIGIGQFILKTDLVLDVIGLLSREAEGLGRAMKNISELGFEALSEGIDSVLAEDITAKELAIERVAERTGQSIEEITEKFKKYDEGVQTTFVDEFGQRSTFFRQVVSDEATEVEGLITKITELTDARRDDFFITKGQTEVNDIFSDSVQNIIDKSLDGINVNKESSDLYEELEYVIGNYEKALNSASGVSEEQRVQYEASIKTLKGYQEQVVNTQVSEEDLAAQREKEQSKNVRKRIKNIKDETKEVVDSLNERARVETAIARTAEEKADIEIERTRLVSQAYEKQAAAIRDLSSEYETQKDVIEEAAKSSDKLAAILTSDIFKDVESSFKDYEKSIKSAQKALKDKKITQEEYNQILEDERGSLVGSIDLFRELAGTSPELEQFFNIILNKFDGLGSSTEETTKSIKEQIKEAFSAENIRGILSQFVSSADEVLSEFNDTQLENTKNRLESEIDAIKNRYKTEEDILKSQLDNQLITESQFRSKSIQLRKNQLREENEIDRQIFEAEKKQDRQDAVIDGAAAIAEAFVTVFRANDPATAAIKAAISSAIIGVQTTAQVSAINSRQFFPKKFEQGGMVSGPSHAEGGVPFTVQGNSGYEMEGGEFIINKRATSMHRDLLERINNSYRTNPQVGRMKFANGGIVQGQANESVDYLKAIAEATTSTAIGVSRPVRAYVSDKDLRSDSNERIIRDRNDRI